MACVKNERGVSLLAPGLACRPDSDDFLCAEEDREPCEILRMGVVGRDRDIWR